MRIAVKNHALPVYKKNRITHYYALAASLKAQYVLYVTLALLVNNNLPGVKVFRINPEFRILMLTSMKSQPQNAILGRL